MHTSVSSFVSFICVAIVVFVCFFGHTSHAQKFSLGVKAGPSITWADFADHDAGQDFQSRPKLGYSVGGFILFPLKNKYSFLSEFGFKQTGRRIKFNEGTWTNNATYRYVDLSMALRKAFTVHIRKNVPTRCFFNIGPNVDYWLYGDGEIKTDVLGTGYKVVFNQQPDGNFHKNYMNNVNRWFFGMDLGLGADANITKTQRVAVELRFTYGHTYIGKKSGTSNLEILGFNDNIKSNFKTLTLSGSYYFDFDLRKSKMGKSTKDKEMKRKRSR